MTFTEGFNSTVHVFCLCFSVLLMICGFIGLFESSRWAAVQSDRPGNFVLGAILLLLGFWLWKVA